ncbi:PIN domain-containing protein [Oscillatoria sp. CS-180]|uniref:type II toxin-antitoxin system VapC family toxin n=1 Tax=Oscillatoria sp. CS-180 TaxID=3021720 RepID=UPI00232B9745|nr:PIN domain-containing protein [Oscillatoria sp. CS-180]MDB9527380.1 PIN domain-containing protein [Oscillatoria sp. CS-180]
MTALADTSGIIALLDKSDLHHEAAVRIAQTERLWVPSTVLPEVDYMVTKYLSVQVATAFLEDLMQSAFQYVAVELPDIKHAIRVIQKYKDVPLGIVDASIVAIAERYQIQRILTLDRRHFSLIQPESMAYLQLLP